MFETLRQPARRLGQREAVALWDHRSQQWNAHLLLRQGNEFRPDDLIVSTHGLDVFRLQGEPVAGITAEIIAAEGKAAKEAFYDVLAQRGAELRVWMDDGYEVRQAG